MGGEGSRVGETQRVDTQREAKTRLRNNMEPGEKMEGWFWLEHWGLLPETGNQ